MRAKGGRRKSKEISFCEDSVPRSAPQPVNRGSHAEAVSVLPSVPELSLMINGLPRPGVHLLQKPGSSGFIARAPPATITPRLSARAIEKVPTTNTVTIPRILPDDEGAVGGIITKEEADAMEFFRELNAQFEEKNRGAPGDTNNPIIILDKCMRNGGGTSKKDKQRVRAAIVASTMSPMPPPPRPTAHMAHPPKAKPSVPELSVLENIPKPKAPSAIVVSAGGRSVKKVNFEEYVEQQQQQQQQTPSQQQQQQQRPKPRKFSECERAMMKFQLESAERRILELEMELSKLQRKRDHTRERGIQAPVVRDKSTQVSPEILAPFKNTKKSKKRADRSNGMENLKIITPTPIPKEPKPKPADDPVKKHDPSADAITQEKLLKALTQINSIFSASRQHDPAAAAAIAAASAKVVASVSSDSSGGDEEAAAAVAAAAARNNEARAARAAAAATTSNDDSGASASSSAAAAAATTSTPTTAFSATTPVFTTGNRTHAMAAQVVRAAFLKATTQRPTVPLGDRSFVMKQLAAKYLPEWQNTLVVRAANEAAARNNEQTNGHDENKKPPTVEPKQKQNGAIDNNPSVYAGPAVAKAAENSVAAIDNLRNYNEFPFDSDDENELEGNATPIVMSPEEKDLLLAFRHRKTMMTDDQAPN